VAKMKTEPKKLDSVGHMAKLNSASLENYKITVAK